MKKHLSSKIRRHIKDLRKEQPELTLDVVCSAVSKRIKYEEGYTDEEMAGTVEEILERAQIMWPAKQEQIGGESKDK